MDYSKRNCALDVVRIFALASVICVHFFLNSGFYTEPMDGKRMLVMCILRTGFMVCVPMFITLTGYLMCRKTWSLKYYGGIAKTLGIYVLASVACITYKITVLGLTIPFGEAIWSIFDFSGANYAWYIEMYIGLFLLAPFLNSMYNGLASKKAKLALIITLIALTSLPSVVNIFNFDVPGWWAQPYLSIQYRKILPDWWTMLYPVTYYCLGAWLKEYPIKIKRWLNILLWAAAVVVFGVFNFYRSRYGFFSWGKYTDWYALPNVIMTFLSFVFLSGLNLSGIPGKAKGVLKYLSDLSLGAYLMSYIADGLVYERLKVIEPVMKKRLEWFVPVVFAVLVMSLAGSAVINAVWALISKTFGYTSSLVTKLADKNKQV